MSRQLVPVTALLLAGCVNMSGLDGESRYACAAPEGVACDSVSGTYANALHHKLPSQRATAPTPNPQIAHPAGTASSPRGAAPPRPSLRGTPPAMADFAAEGRPASALRSPPRLLRLWTKPWEDVDGDLWDQGYVYVQVDSGRWQLEHVQQRIRERYIPLQPPPVALPGTSTPSAGLDPPAAPSDSSTEGIGHGLPSSPFNALPRHPRPSGTADARQP